MKHTIESQDSTVMWFWLAVIFLVLAPVPTLIVLGVVFTYQAAKAVLGDLFIGLDRVVAKIEPSWTVYTGWKRALQVLAYGLGWSLALFLVCATLVVFF